MSCTRDRPLLRAALGTTAQYWLNLQNNVDLFDARERLAASGTMPHRMEALEAA